MANRASGPLRWGEDERRLLRRYLQEGRIDFTRLNDVPYLRSLMDGEVLWSRHIPRNFYQNVRRACSTWEANENAVGGRGNQQQPPPAATPPRPPPEQEDIPDEDDDVFDDAPEDNSEFSWPSPHRINSHSHSLLQRRSRQERAFFSPSKRRRHR